MAKFNLRTVSENDISWCGESAINQSELPVANRNAMQPPIVYFCVSFGRISVDVYKMGIYAFKSIKSNLIRQLSSHILL